MGKHWRGGRGGDNRDNDRDIRGDRSNGGGRGGGRGGGHGGGGNDLASCRGYGIVIGTCDAAREKETSKELVNLFSMMLEDESLFPKQSAVDDAKEVSAGILGTESSSSGSSLSIKDMLAKELSEVRESSHQHAQAVRSIQTNVKGITCIKIMRKDVCPVQLVKSVFDKVRREKLACTRHVVRLIPLQRVFYPNEEEFHENIQLLVKSVFPSKTDASAATGGNALPEAMPVSSDGCGTCDAAIERSCISSEAAAAVTLDGSDAVGSSVVDELEQGKLFAAAIMERMQRQQPQLHQSSLNPSKQAAGSNLLQYNICFKARNHNVVTKDFVYGDVIAAMGDSATFNCRKFTGMVMMEALKNIGGISYISDYDSLDDLNLRKFQLRFVATNSVSLSVSSSALSGTKRSFDSAGLADQVENSVDEGSAEDSDNYSEEH